jgi:hypothetical protein
VDNHDRFFETVVSQSHHFHQSHQPLGFIEPLIHHHTCFISKVLDVLHVQEQLLLFTFVDLIQQSSFSLLVQTTHQVGVQNNISVWFKSQAQYIKEFSFNILFGGFIKLQCPIV